MLNPLHSEHTDELGPSKPILLAKDKKSLFNQSPPKSPSKTQFASSKKEPKPPKVRVLSAIAKPLLTKKQRYLLNRCSSAKEATIGAVEEAEM
jgi:hypothetical protein